MPPTQAYPAQPYPGQPYPGQPYPGGQPPVPPKKSRTGLYVVGAIVVVGGIVGGVIAFSGGNDNKTVTLGGTDTKVTSVVTTTSAVVEPTAAATTEPALVITAPATTQGPATTVPSGTDVPADVQHVSDKTNTFSAYLPTAFNTDVNPVTTSGVTFSQISGSADLSKYGADNDTFGITLLTAPSSQLADPAQLVQNLDPGATVCTSRQTESARPTSQGPVEVLRLDGCGATGASAKVIMAIVIPSTNKTLIAVAQGPGPSDGSLLTFTQAVLETVVYG